jgi:hypothetical protein
MLVKGKQIECMNIKRMQSINVIITNIYKIKLDFNLLVRNIEIFIPIFSHDTIQPIDRPREGAYIKDARHGIYIHNNSQIH